MMGDDDRSAREMIQLAETWLAYQADLNDIREREGGDAVSTIIRNETDPRAWSADRVVEISSERSLHDVWMLVKALCARVTDTTRSAIIDVGAQPLENMITRFGDEALALIQQEIGRDAVLREALSSVWVGEPLRTRMKKMVAEYED